MRRTVITRALANVRAAHDSATDPDLIEIAALLEQYASTVDLLLPQP